MCDEKIFTRIIYEKSYGYCLHFVQVFVMCDHMTIYDILFNFDTRRVGAQMLNRNFICHFHLEKTNKTKFKLTFCDITKVWQVNRTVSHIHLTYLIFSWCMYLTHRYFFFVVLEWFRFFLYFNFECFLFAKINMYINYCLTYQNCKLEFSLVKV